MSASKTKRRVCVMLMNSHQHMELVEIETLVRITGSFDKPSYDLIEEEAEQAARQVMARNGVDHSDFSYVCTLVGVTQGLHTGRITYGKTPETAEHNVKVVW